MIVNNEFAVMYDVCVIGSCPAGIIFALEYARLNSEKKIVIIEYGRKGLNGKNALDDSITIANTVNHHDPYECTNKGLGGTSATWGGRCVMYDEVDFIDRPIVSKGCTWNYELFDEIKNYTKIAAEYFECGNDIFCLDDVAELKNTRISENFVPGDVTDSVIERWSMPTRFGSRYDKAIRNNSNITLLEGFEARDFSKPNSEGTVDTLTVRGLNQEIHTINARTFVLAAGAQETTRTLLRNRQLFANLTSVPDSLGKYYQGHLSGKIASVNFTGDPKKTDYGFIRQDDVYLRRRFQFTTKFLVEQNLLNTAIWLDNPLYFNPKHRSGAMSFMYLAMITPFLGKRLAPPAIAHSITKGKVTGLPNHFANILRQLPKSLTVPASIFYKRYFLNRKLPGVFLFSPRNQYALHFHSEQIPDARNRMELGPDGESLVIHYSLLDKDIESVIQLHDVLDKKLRNSSAGALEYWYEKSELVDAIRNMSRDGIHQSGTTRIAGSPEEGVIDHDLKVWGTKNVFVCSSSAFPTSGQANPTFMIGAFAARLALYLKKRNENS